MACNTKRSQTQSLSMRGDENRGFTDLFHNVVIERKRERARASMREESKVNITSRVKKCV